VNEIVDAADMSDRSPIGDTINRRPAR